MRLGRTAATLFVSQVIVTVAGFVGTLYIARVLGPAVLGTYALLVALVSWSTVPANGVNFAIKKRLSERGSTGSEFWAGVVINGLTALAIGSLAILFEGRLASYLGANLVVGFIALVAGTVAFRTIGAWFEGRKRVVEFGVLGMVERVLRTGAQITLMVLGWELGGVIAGHVLAVTLAGVVGLAVARPALGTPGREEFRRITSFARYSWLQIVHVRAFAWMDTIVLGIFVGNALIGVYEVSWRLASTLALVSIAVQRTLFPEFSELDSEGDYERIHHYLNEGLVFAGVFAVPGLVGAALIGERVLAVYRPEFTQGATVLLILILARVLEAFASQFNNAINAVDRPDLAFRISLGFVLSNLVLNVALIYAIGWTGAAIATAASAAISLGLGFVFLGRLIGRPDLPVGEFGRQVIASLAMGGVVYGADAVVSRNHYVTVGLVVLGGVVYVATLLAVSTRIRTKARNLLPYEMFRS